MNNLDNSHRQKERLRTAIAILAFAGAAIALGQLIPGGVAACIGFVLLGRALHSDRPGISGSSAHSVITPAAPQSSQHPKIDSGILIMILGAVAIAVVAKILYAMLCPVFEAIG